jgi:hypothetical protein
MPTTEIQTEIQWLEGVALDTEHELSLNHFDSRVVEPNHMNLSVLKSEKFVIAVEAPSGKFKLFQIVCGRDGSIFVPFPYYKHSSAQLTERTLNGGQKYPSDLNVAGPLTMHHVKYTHHMDGEAHFSQHGKILTKIRRRANSLQAYSGHLFTVQLQGLSDFEQVKDGDLHKSGRLLVCGRLPSEPASLKLVAHVYSAAELAQRMVSRDDSGPWIRTVRDQKEYAAALLAVGDNANPTARILTLSFEDIPTVFLNQPSGFCFLGGFDAPETAFDHTQDTSFLVLLSPAGDDPSAIARQFGSVDLT